MMTSVRKFMLMTLLCVAILAPSMLAAQSESGSDDPPKSSANLAPVDKAAARAARMAELKDCPVSAWRTCFRPSDFWLFDLHIWLLILLTPFAIWCASLIWLARKGFGHWSRNLLRLTVMEPPTGMLFTIVSVFGVARNSEDPLSPREGLDRFVASRFVQVGAIVLLLFLTAISVLGGLIVFGLFWLSYYRLRSRLPGPVAGSARAEAQAHLQPTEVRPSSSTYSTSSGYERDYEDPRRYEREDRDSNRDERHDSKSSIWDGWLVKW